MNIIKIEKLKNSKYKLYIDDFSLVIYDDVILNNNLLFQKEINEDLLLKIKEENNYYELLNLSIKYISKRLRSEFEIKKYLEKKTNDTYLIDNIINELIDKKLIDDQRFTTAYINDKLNFSKCGILKIKNDLINLGIDQNLINDTLNNIDYKKNDNLKQMIDKKIKNNHKYSSNYLKQKITNDMINLGYVKEDIISILDNYNLDDNEIYQKEYDKLYNKLSKKYQGKELEYQIKNRLYIKGFKKN